MKDLKINIEQKQNKGLDWNLEYKKTIIDLNTKPSRPPHCITIGIDDTAYKGVHYPLRFATYGNISMIMAEEKARKTFLKSMIISCAIGGKANNYSENIVGHGLENKYIIDIDTEQGEFDAWSTSNRIKEMCGALPENYVAIELREYKNKERRQYIEWLFNESIWRGNIGLCSIDGYVDCVEDFNDRKECSDFTSDLMKYSKKEDCHIMGLLHVNPGTEKGRGHLGTIIQQKCETIIYVKNEGEYSKVTRKRGRGKSFKDFGLAIDDNWLPYEIELNDIDVFK